MLHFVSAGVPQESVTGSKPASAPASAPLSTSGMRRSSFVPKPIRPAAGWLADPTGRFDQRYWDGSGWTDHVAKGNEVSKDPPLV